MTPLTSSAVMLGALVATMTLLAAAKVAIPLRARGRAKRHHLARISC